MLPLALWNHIPEKVGTLLRLHSTTNCPLFNCVSHKINFWLEVLKLLIQRTRLAIFYPKLCFYDQFITVVPNHSKNILHTRAYPARSKSSIHQMVVDSILCIYSPVKHHLKVVDDRMLFLAIIFPPPPSCPFH